MKYTDSQLKYAVSEMISVVYAYHGDLFWHFSEYQNHKPVLDSELLHLCWLIEETLNAVEKHDYYHLYLPENEEWTILHLTWQQRTTALTKVKRIKIV